MNAAAGHGGGGTAPATDAGGAPEPSIPVDSPLIERIRGLSYVLLEDLAHAPGSERLDALRARGMQYLFPMKVKGEIRGVLAAGPRREGQPLSREDVELLVALCGHAAAALESARSWRSSRASERVERCEEQRGYSESSQVGILVVDPDGTIRP